MKDPRPTFAAFKTKALKNRKVALYYYLLKPFFALLNRRLRHQ